MEEKEVKIQKAKKVLSILKLLLLFGIVAGLTLIIWFNRSRMMEIMGSRKALEAFLEAHQKSSILIYIVLQIMQVIIAVIPGNIVQFAGGYVFGILGGYFLSVAGIAIGTACSYYLAKLLGRDGMRVIFGEERINRYINHLNSPKAVSIIFLLFLIPGFPKDLIPYAAGVSDFKFWPFLLISMVGRTPAMLATLIMGRMADSRNYIGLIILGLIGVILFIIGWFKRDKLTDWLNKFSKNVAGEEKRD